MPYKWFLTHSLQLLHLDVCCIAPLFNNLLRLTRALPMVLSEKCALIMSSFLAFVENGFCRNFLHTNPRHLFILFIFGISYSLLLPNILVLCCELFCLVVRKQYSKAGYFANSICYSRFSSAPLFEAFDVFRILSNYEY